MMACTRHRSSARHVVKSIRSQIAANLGNKPVAYDLAPLQTTKGTFMPSTPIPGAVHSLTLTKPPCQAMTHTLPDQRNEAVSASPARVRLCYLYTYPRSCTLTPVPIKTNERHLDTVP